MKTLVYVVSNQPELLRVHRNLVNKYSLTLDATTQNKLHTKDGFVELRLVNRNNLHRMLVGLNPDEVFFVDFWPSMSEYDLAISRIDELGRIFAVNRPMFIGHTTPGIVLSSMRPMFRNLE